MGENVAMSTSQARSEHPQPQFVRETWLNLNGEWEFDYDDQASGERERWYDGKSLPKRINVPYCFQSKLSGIGETDFHDIVWYRRSFSLPKDFAGKNVLLHFGAVDYHAKVWVNGKFVKEHIGGHTPFSIDITLELTSGENVIVVRAHDSSKDITVPRGKQFWEEKSKGIFYTRTTGIWQTVWLEAVHPVHLRRAMLTPDIENNEVGVRSFVEGWQAGAKLQLKLAVSFKGKPICEETFAVNNPVESRRISLNDFSSPRTPRLWSPEAPNLYDITLSLLQDGVEVDSVASYFGMRKISIEQGKVCLNNRPYFMKLVLDQGYFPDGILTAPTDEDLRRDVELTKAMGFNGARKHQKVEDPRYMYWCDKLGLLVWGEMANAYAYSEDYVRRITGEWQEAIERDYNHPCIVAWVPLNESWGVPEVLNDSRQQQHSLALYHMIKSLDATRPVISNDGWEHTKSDICTIHDYEFRREVLEKRYADAEIAVKSQPGRKFIYANGFEYNGEPINVSEFGGISFRKSEWEGWGYSGAENDQDFLDRLVAVIHPLLKAPAVQGYCYTQLTDVEQEINGLLTYDRVPKLPLDVFKAINNGKVPTLDK
jgi:beta-galactosidase/beta-glucuronidase